MASRRRFLRDAAAWAALALTAVNPRRVLAAPAFINDPFQLGVACGDPTSDGFVLWTRLAPDPLDPHALPDESIPVAWEIAADAGFKKIVRSGQVLAHPQFAHSVHVDVSGLPPARDYFYRFHAGSAVSRAGRARTWPAYHAPVDRLRFAAACCQSFEEGYFSAYRDMIARDPDFILHLGDYIYENTRGTAVRHAPVADAYRLDEYRALHAAYKLDPDLQAAHAQCPWLYMWDDHEVANDYTIDQSNRTMDPAVFLKRKAAGYQAAYEHMPLRIGAKVNAMGQAIMYERLAYGDLAAFTLIDRCQFRDHLPCNLPDNPGGRVVTAGKCPELNDPRRTMLGDAQERWFNANFYKNDSLWNVITQTQMLSELDQTADGSTDYGAFSDSWGGYPAARRKILNLVRDKKVPNCVALGGDVHSFFVSDIRDNDKDPRSALLMTEFVATSVTTDSTNYAVYAGMMPKNPQVKFFDDRVRGYLWCDLSRTAWKTDLRAVDNVRIRDGKFSTLKAFAVEAGRPGTQAG